jgi:cytochrome c biogenesis protein CcmG/thiol:disulfide interchange protein DsbE
VTPEACGAAVRDQGEFLAGPARPPADPSITADPKAIPLDPPSRLVGVRRALPFIAAVAVATVLVIGLTQAGGQSRTPQVKPFDLQAALGGLQGAPGPLASLHGQASEILGGGAKALQTRLKALRGHPVVVNKWASWCGPCRHEFPFFERVSAKRGKDVAFVGLNSGDNTPDAKQFLREFPLTYPSYEDPEEQAARAVGAPANYPVTVFFDAKGRQAFIRQGGYASEAQLERDIDRYIG